MHHPTASFYHWEYHLLSYSELYGLNFNSPPSPSPVEIVFTTDRNYFYACWKRLLRCLLGKVETERGCSRDSSLHFVPLRVRGEGCHPWSLAFIRMARLESVAIRYICVIRVPSFILPPRVFCGKSMLAPRLHFKKCSSARFDYQVFALHFLFFLKKSL